MQSNPTVHARINAAVRQTRDISELIGVCKGVLADGVVNFSEAAFMLQWLEMHKECLAIWPASELYTTLDTLLEDGRLSNDEERQLLSTLIGITGVQVDLSTNDTEPQYAQTSSELPLHEPTDGLIFQDRNFCLTGTFEYGTRAQCEKLVAERGGLTQKAPTQKTHYLVIGNIGSRDWAHSSFGRKIQKAAEMRRDGQQIYIITEQLFTEQL